MNFIFSITSHINGNYRFYPISKKTFPKDIFIAIELQILC